MYQLKKIPISRLIAKMVAKSHFKKFTFEIPINWKPTRRNKQLYSDSILFSFIKTAIAETVSSQYEDIFASYSTRFYFSILIFIYFESPAVFERYLRFRYTGPYCAPSR